MTGIESMKQDALEALDDLDDFARWDCGIDPITEVNHLTVFINAVCARLEAAEKDAELWKEHALMLGSQTDEAVKELREYVEVLEAKLANIENKGGCDENV